jgi:site-specific recombinase XerD
VRRAGQEALDVARCVSAFLCDYAPRHLTGSAHTLRSYRCAIRLYLGYLESELGVGPESLRWSHFSGSTVEGWCAWLEDSRRNSASTRNVRLGALRTFLSYAAKRHPEAAGPRQESAGIPRKRCPKPKVGGLTRDAVRALMRAPDTSTRTGRRDLALMVALYATAARLDEVLSLTVADVRLAGRRPCVTVVGKGRKTRTLYLQPRAADQLRAYVREFHGDAPDPGSRLFYARRTDHRSKLSQTAVAKRLRIHAASAHGSCADVPLGLHAHQFRHARASHWLEDGMNVVQISFLLGHEQLQTTMVYLDVTVDQKLDALGGVQDDVARSASPRWPGGVASLAELCGL